MLRSIAARRERRRFHCPSALRCVSKHEGGVHVLILRDARTRVRVCGTFSACALLRMRTRITAHDLEQHTLPRSRGAFFRPGFCIVASLTPNRGVGGAPRNVRVLSGTPVGRIMTRYARRLARRLASHDAGRSPLGAPPWRFWASGPRFSHRHPRFGGRRIGSSELLAARS